MKSLGCVLTAAICLGVDCGSKPTMTSFEIQYVNNSKVNVLFRAIDSRNINVGEHSMSSRTPFDAADPVITIEGVPPIIFDIPFVNQQASCMVPPFLDSDVGTVPVKFTIAESGKVFRVEATADQELECSQE